MTTPVTQPLGSYPGSANARVIESLLGRPQVSTLHVVEERSRGLILGASDYLVKPVSRDALLSSLAHAGISLQHLLGVKVLLLDSGNGELLLIEGELRRAGCEVRREQSFSPETLVPRYTAVYARLA